MASAVWILTALALGLAGMALWLWDSAQRAHGRRVALRHLAQQIAASADVPAATAPTADPRRSAASGGLSGDPWAAAQPEGDAVATRRSLRLPGWLEGVVSTRQLGTALAGGAIAVAAVAMLAGPVAAGALALLLALGGMFAIWLLLQRSRRRLVGQLPAFIDALVRLIVIGNSIHAAFQLSTATLKAPLRQHMEGAAALVRAGVDLDQALGQMAQRVRVEELHLLAAIMGLGVRYGGRADVLLERVAAFMRDREQAQHELVAMSAETRLSAWVLGLLPVGVGAAIVLVNPGYFARMWHDGTGQTLIFGALGLQLLGAVLLYRLARVS